MEKSKVISHKSHVSYSGVSLIEMLMVIFVFSILGVVVTRVVSLSLRGTTKSENVSVVKQNVDFAISTMERQLRSAVNLDCNLTCGPLDPCSDYELYYNDGRNSVNNTYFRCVTSGTDTYIASSSGTLPDVRLTSPDVQITNCSSAPFIFTCNSSSKPDSVEITITGRRAGTTGAEGSQVTSSTKVLLRNY